MDTDSQDELKDISPFLYSSKIQHPFFVDEYYFNQLQQNLMNRLEEEQKSLLEHIIPAKQHVFDVPEDYFQKLPENLLMRVQSNNHQPSRVIKREIVLEKVWLAAASIVILIGLTFGLLMRQPHFNSTENQSFILASAEYSMLENASEIDEGTIIAFLNQEMQEQKGIVQNQDDQNGTETENLLLEVIDIDPELAELANELSL